MEDTGVGENVAGGGGHREAAFQVTRPQPCFRSGREDSPRTRFSGSLMLTVWSWEADKELLMDRSAVGTSGGNTEEMASGLQIAFPGEDLTHQTWRVHRGAPHTEKLVRRRETRTNMGEHQQAPSAYLGRNVD